MKVYKSEYKNYEIHFRNIGKLWEYLVVIDGKIYTAHIIIKPRWYKKLYSEKETKEIIKILEKMAQTTIDTKCNTT